MQVKKCPKCQATYSHSRREPCCKCATPLVDYKETPEEELKRLESQKRLKNQERASNIIRGSLKFIFQIVLWILIIPAICAGVYHFVELVIIGDMSVNRFFSSIGDFTYEFVFSCYEKIIYEIRKIF